MVRTFKDEEIRGKSDMQARIKEAREKEITHEELFQAAEIFEDDTDAASDSWIRTRRFVDWKNLHNLPTNEVKRRIIGFLNEWHCRLPSTERLAERIKEAYRLTIPFLRAVENETLEDFQFDKKKVINGKEYTNS